MKRTNYLGFAAGIVFSIGLVAEMCSGVYYNKYNEPLEHQLHTEQNRVYEFEKQIHMYERRIECVEDPHGCSPARTIEFELVPMLEVTTEGQ